MTVKRKAWQRPFGSEAPNRSGDREEIPIYTALGRAVSAWEGVNAASVALMRACLENGEHDPDEKLIVFGEETRVHQRAKLIRQEFRSYLVRRGGHGSKAVTNMRGALSRVLEAYVEWAARRNDLAHGYVTAADGPDYEDDNQPIVRTFALLPSHARTGKWLEAQPEFNYRAADIEQFAFEFARLDARLEALAKRVSTLGE